MTSARGRRLDGLEAAARRLLPQAPEPFDQTGWISWLTKSELERLERFVEQQPPDAPVDVPEDLYRRAIARALLDTDMAALDEQERATGQLLRLPNPDRPDDRIYVSVFEDLRRGSAYHRKPAGVLRPGLLSIFVSS